MPIIFNKIGGFQTKREFCEPITTFQNHYGYHLDIYSSFYAATMTIKVAKKGQISSKHSFSWRGKRSKQKTTVGGKNPRNIVVRRKLWFFYNMYLGSLSAYSAWGGGRGVGVHVRRVPRFYLSFLVLLATSAKG
jgi:hypothetical protein